MRWMRMLLVALLVLGAAVPVLAQPPAPVLYDSEQPGSVLVFPKFITGLVGPAAGPLLPRSSFEISVTCPAGRSCPEFTDAVKLKAVWVCPGSQNPNRKRICSGTDFELFTTVKGTLWFNPDNAPTALAPQGVPPAPIRVPLVPAPSCARGYLIVYVINNLDQPISFNSLIGNAIIRQNANDAAAYNGIPIQSPQPVGTVLAQDGSAPLAFDGTMYARVTNNMFGTVRYERVGTVNVGEIRTSLTLLTLDVRLNRPNLVTFVPLYFYNEAERVISTYKEFICWSETRLTGINRNLNTGFQGLGAFKGLVETPPPGATQQNTNFPFDTFPATLLGIIWTQEWNGAANATPDRSYSYGLYHDEVGVPTHFCPINSNSCPVP